MGLDFNTGTLGGKVQPIHPWRPRPQGKKALQRLGLVRLLGNAQLSLSFIDADTL